MGLGHQPSCSYILNTYHSLSPDSANYGLYSTVEQVFIEKKNACSSGSAQFKLMSFKDNL